MDMRIETCINRNILECKGKITAISCGLQPVLIETYWNVKTRNSGATWIEKWY